MHICLPFFFVMQGRDIFFVEQRKIAQKYYNRNSSTLSRDGREFFWDLDPG